MINGKVSTDATLDCYLFDIKVLASRLEKVQFLFIRRSMAAHATASHTTLYGDSFLWDALSSEFLFNIFAEVVNILIRVQ